MDYITTTLNGIATAIAALALIVQITDRPQGKHRKRKRYRRGKQK